MGERKSNSRRPPAKLTRAPRRATKPKPKSRKTKFALAPSTKITPDAPTHDSRPMRRGARAKTEGWSAPYLSSPYTEPPHPMESAKMIIVEFEPDPVAAREAVPDPLELGPNPMAVAVCGDNRQMPTSAVFQEGMIVLSVRLGDQVGSFTPYIWTSTDEAMLAAREISGRPKLLCDHNTIQEMGSQATSKITRRGETLMRVSIALEKKGQASDLPFGGEWFSVRKIQMPEKGRPALKQVIQHGLTGSFQAFSIWEGRGFVELPGQAFSAVHRLKPRRIGRAWLAHVSWDLSWGKIVWENWVPAMMP
jgi:hypothetical protein